MDISLKDFYIKFNVFLDESKIYMGTKPTKGKSLATTNSDNGGGKLTNKIQHSSSYYETSSSADEVDEDLEDFFEEKCSASLPKKLMTLEQYRASMYNT